MSLGTNHKSLLKRSWQCLLLGSCFLATSLSAATVRELLAEFESGATTQAHSAADHKVGRSKEVSRFQILPVVWREYTKSQQYTDPEIAWSVAERILQDRQEDF